MNRREKNLLVERRERRRRITTTSLLAVAGVALVGAVLFAFSGEDATTTAYPRAPSFAVQTTDGENLTSADLQGKVYALDFFFLTCGICKQQLPENREMVEALADRDDFVFVSVTADPADTTELINEHREMEGATWPHVRDPGRLYGDFQVRGNPNIVFVDRDGNVRETVTRITQGETLLHHAQALLDEA